MIYMTFILYILYFEYAINLATIAPVRDEYGRVMDIEDNPNYYRFIVAGRLVVFPLIFLTFAIIKYSFVVYSVVLLQKNLKETLEKASSLVVNLAGALEGREDDEY